jgi:hypothetical protein
MKIIALEELQGKQLKGRKLKLEFAVKPAHHGKKATGDDVEGAMLIMMIALLKPSEAEEDRTR